MYKEEKPNHKDPVGRFVLLRSFDGKQLRRHAEWNSMKYLVMCAQALVKNKINKVTHVQVIDVMHGNALVYEGRA